MRMVILPISERLTKFLQVRRLEHKFQKQRQIFENNPSHPGLRLELLEPRHLHFFSFRVDKKYRAIFILLAPNVAEIIDINNHYQ